ncbi:hypothetical protein NEPTK9_000351 [Candidatus Neptunochlamydia vexilliferae]|uniref:MOMP-like family protein n=2 Tax=Candidatus Neptunichlamydia vexilliferae TaxID=1651774 RepID=A0ABS0AZ07_9BACT|nr:hypothetical protein [Candidatus Neptunochlamydia vexilliferae]
MMMHKKFLLLLLVPAFVYAQQQVPPDEQDLFNKDDAVVVINGEFLFWSVNEGALDYAIRMKKPAWGPSNSYAQGDFEQAEFDFDPGYRFSIGYYRAPNFWEADFEWTYIHFKGTDRIKRSSSPEQFTTGTFPQVFSNPIDHATSRIQLHYKTADLIAHRVFHIDNNPHLRLKLLGAFSGVWTHQNWKVRYFDAGTSATSTTNRWKYWGFGFRTGLSFDWFWGNHFYTTGKFTTALVIGRYKNHSKQTVNTPSQPGDNALVPVRDARYRDYRVSFTTQLLLGPSYQRSFNKWRFEIFAGYEMNIWTNLQEIFRSTAAPASGAKETWLSTGLVALQGLTLRGSVNF